MIRLLLLSLILVTVVAEVPDELLKKAKIKRGAWTTLIEVEQPPRKGRPQPNTVAALWLPEGVETIRGLFWPGHVMIDRKLATDGSIRAALAKEGMGVFWYQSRGKIAGAGGERSMAVLKQLAEASGHPEVADAPFLTAGHSAAGLFCRNVGYWQPDRTIAVVMIKSGNFHHGLEDMSASLKGVPLIHFVGEFEEYGPEGGDLKGGLRSIYATQPSSGEGKSRNQTQWVMTRMQMLDRRRKNPDNCWSLVVHRGGSHTKWHGDLTKLLIQYIHSTVAARLPAGAKRCIPLTAADGVLYDADIKNPTHATAPFAEYAGDKLHAFWAPDATMAAAIDDYHNQGPWGHPDPTAGQPAAERYTPPPILRDFIDAPPPPIQRWPGGDGSWSKAGKEPAQWQVGNATSTPDSGQQVAIDSGTVTVTGQPGCTGLQLGACTLALGTNKLKSRWHTTMTADTVITVTLHPKSPGRAGRWGGALSIGGNGTIAGKLIIDVAEDAVLGSKKGVKPDSYAMVSIKGTRQGDFGEVVLPDGLTGKWIGNNYCVIVPKAE